jgi:Uma2 family endonuclease
MTPAISEQVRWTIADLEGFPENGNSYEIIDGELFVTRAPHLDHQDVAGLLYAELENGVLKKAMTLFNADCLTSPLLPGFSCEVESLFGGNNKLSNQ